jgi:hypothetical protein
MCRITSRATVLALALTALTLPGLRASAQSSTTPPPTAPPVTGTNPEPQVTGTNPEPQDDIIHEILVFLHLV